MRGTTRSTLEKFQKGVGGNALTNLKTQVPKIDSFTKKMELSVRASLNRLKELTYVFSSLCQRIGFIENFENERSIREDESSLGDLHWMVGSL